MNLQAALSAALPSLRREAEARMTDTFTAYSPASTTKDADGWDVPTFNDEGSVPGYIQGQGRDTETTYVQVGSSTQATSNGVQRPVVHGGLRIPITARLPVAGARGRGWEYECTAVGPSSDPALLGRRWLVWEVPAKSAATARRLTVVEVTDGRK